MANQDNDVPTAASSMAFFHQKEKQFLEQSSIPKVPSISKQDVRKAYHTTSGVSASNQTHRPQPSNSAPNQRRTTVHEYTTSTTNAGPSTATSVKQMQSMFSGLNLAQTLRPSNGGQTPSENTT